MSTPFRPANPHDDARKPSKKAAGSSRGNIEAQSTLKSSDKRTLGPDSDKGIANKRARVVPDRKIVIAVDFGTTYSGLAWAQTGQPKEHAIIDQWPDTNSEGLDGFSCEKVPTEILYKGEKIKWGCQIGESEPRHKWFKLGLDPSSSRATASQTMVSAESSSLSIGSKSAVQMTSDYLTALRKHIDLVLRQKLTAGFFDSSGREYILTVPAIWSEGAEAKTRACAEAAGMGIGRKLQIVSEPEAAAVYALNRISAQGVKAGDTFVLVDAGGGTVDLITYTVTQLQPILKLVEAAPGTGGFCGSSFVNRQFESFLRKKFKNHPKWDKEILDEATRDFDSSIKRKFGAASDEGLLVRVPGLPDDPSNNIRRGRLRLTRAEVEAIFEPVIQDVIKLVLDQIKAAKKPITTVILVGGFSQSPYLLSKIRAVVGKTEVIQSPNGWSAVARGALMKGLAVVAPESSTVEVTERGARRYSGTESHKLFDPAVHDGARKWYDNAREEYRIDTMDWFVKKGDIIEENKPIFLPYVYESKAKDGKPKELNATIYCYNDPSDDGAPMYPDSDIPKLAELRADLTKLKMSDFHKITGADGKRYYKVEFEIAVTKLSTTFHFELVYKGKNYGDVNAEYY